MVFYMLGNIVGKWVNIQVSPSVFYILYYFLLEEVRRGFEALNAKLTKLALWIGCPSYHSTSWRKSALIQKPLCKYLKPFISIESLKRQKRFRCKCFDKCFGLGTNGNGIASYILDELF